MWLSVRLVPVFLAVLSATPAFAADAGNDPVTAPWPGFAGSFLIARAAETRGDWEVAEKAFADLSIRDPYTPELMHRQSVLLLNQGKFDQAVMVSQRMADKGVAPHLAQLLLFAESTKDNDPAAIKTAFAGMSDDGLGQFVKPFFKAWMAPDLKQAAAALSSLKGQGILTGANQLHMALLAERFGNTAKARESFALALASEPSYRAIELAAAFYKRNNMSKSLEELKQTALRNNIDSIWLAGLDADQTDRSVNSLREGVAETIFALASLLQKEGANEAALSYLRLVSALRPELDLARISMADLLVSVGRYDEASALLTGLSEAGSLREIAALRLASLESARGSLPQAQQRLEALLQQHPEWAEAWQELASTFSAAGDLSAALVAYDKALKFSEAGGDDVLRAQLYYARGTAAHQRQDFVAAEADLSAAIKLQPDNVRMLNHLGYLLADRGVRLDEAAALVIRALKAEPNNPNVLDSLGWVRYKQGQVEEAVRLLELSAELVPYNTTINDHLGDAYWAAGRAYEARFQWQRAITYRDNAEPTLTSLEELRNKIATGLPMRQTAASH